MLQSTEPLDINHRGEIAGFYFDNIGAEHGFIHDNGTFTTIDVPGATRTEAVSVNDRGEVAGSYTDSSGTHAFLASAVGKSGMCAAVTLHDLLTSDGGRTNMGDFLPGASAKGGQSAHTMSWSDPLDNAPWSGSGALAHQGSVHSTALDFIELRGIGKSACPASP